MIQDVLKVHRERQAVAFRVVGANAQATAAAAATATTTTSAATTPRSTGAPAHATNSARATTWPALVSAAISLTLSLGRRVALRAKSKSLTDSQVGNHQAGTLAKVARNDLSARGRVRVERPEPRNHDAGLGQIRGVSE